MFQINLRKTGGKKREENHKTRRHLPFRPPTTTYTENEKKTTKKKPKIFPPLPYQYWEIIFFFLGQLWRNVGNFENIFEIFWNYFTELFRIFSRNLKISKKWRKSKIWMNSRKIMEKHPGNFKLLILRKLPKNTEFLMTVFKRTC